MGIFDTLSSLGSDIFSLATTIVVFIFIFGILIVLHELGHFWAARKAGVRVLEFGFGMPPKIWGKKTSRTFIDEEGKEKTEEMEWTINAIPFGGFVRMLGEDGESSAPDAFGNRPLLWRMLVICGGVIMNFLLGWFLLTIAFSVGMDPSPTTKEQYDEFVSQGLIAEKTGMFVLSVPESETQIEVGDMIISTENFPEIETMRFDESSKEFISATVGTQNELQKAMITITSVQEGLPASLAGLQTGDIIIKVNEYDSVTETVFIEEIQNSVASSLPLSVHIEREGAVQTLSITPSIEGKIGVSFGYDIPEQNDAIIVSQRTQAFLIAQQKYSLTQAPQEAFFYCFTVMKGVFNLLGDLVSKLTSSLSLPDEIGGPVAIAHQTDQILEYGNIMNLVVFTAMLSLSLAVINIMPFPGLDGGRFVFLLIEAFLIAKAWIFINIFKAQSIQNTKVNPAWEGWINTFGFLSLLILLFWITGRDIITIFF